MKFEHILQIYWTKGFFFGGKLFYFSYTIKELLIKLYGIGLKFLNLIKKRFELSYFFQKIQVLPYYQNLSINIIFSQINSVNNQLSSLKRLNIIKLYLIKSYRGKAHALGKPVRGQNTWSNAWNSFKVNKDIRGFINETQKQLKKKLVI